MLELTSVTKVFYPGTVNEKLAIDDVTSISTRGRHLHRRLNGSGKSTLFNLIAGTYPVTAGTMIFDGEDITAKPEYRRAMTIGRIFQDPTRNGGQHVHRGQYDHRRDEGDEGAAHQLEQREAAAVPPPALLIGLEDRLKDNVGLLSGGQRQALTLLMMVMSSPKMVLLDEHTAALDPATPRR